MELYVGMDVHSKQSVFVIEDQDGNVVARGEVPTSRDAGFHNVRVLEENNEFDGVTIIKTPGQHGRGPGASSPSAKCRGSARSAS